MRISDWSSDVCSSDLSLPTTGHLQDYLGELESLRVATAEKVEEAVAEWRNSLSSTVSSSLDAKGATPFDTLFKPWLTALQSGATAEKPEATKREIGRAHV